MRNILIKSNVYSYIIIKTFFLKPMEEGVLLDDGLYISEYRSLKNLVDTKKIIISEEDYLYILDKLKVETPGSEPSTPVDAYTKDEVNNLLETKLNVNGVAVSALNLSQERQITLTGDVTGTGLFDGSDNLSIETLVDLSSTLKVNDSRISGWDTAVENTHIHSNKSILDSTSASFTVDLKNKLEGISVNANNYSHPSSSAIGTYNKVTVNNLGHVTSGVAVTNIADLGITNVYNKVEVDSALNNKASKDIATESTSGLMSPLDKTKLNSIEVIKVVKLTQAQYDALDKETKEQVGTLYIIVELT